MLSWISSVIVNFIGSAQKKELNCDKILCVNSRYIHLIEPSLECNKALDLRNKILGNHKIRYVRRKIFGSKRSIVRQIVKSSDGEFVLSTLH